MAELIAIAYQEDTTAAKAAALARWLAHDLRIEPDAVAVIRRDGEGKYHVTTTHHPAGPGPSWGLFWPFLFGSVFFRPVLGLVVAAGLDPSMTRLVESDIDEDFQDRLRDLVGPDTSALFLVVQETSPEDAVRALSVFGGTVLTAVLSDPAEPELRAGPSGPVPTAAGIGGP